jgi:hypothetical protein
MSSVLTGLFQLRFERLADVTRELVVAVAKPLFMIAVVEDDVIRGVEGLIVVDRRTRFVQKRYDDCRIDLSAKPAAFDNDALR